MGTPMHYIRPDIRPARSIPRRPTARALGPVVCRPGGSGPGNRSGSTFERGRDDSCFLALFVEERRPRRNRSVAPAPAACYDQNQDARRSAWMI
jgi:hypothetical protein